jgi:trans-2-enoyl-CoA reductase
VIKIRFKTLQEEHRLRMSENQVLRRIFGPKREDVREVWRKVHNEEIHNLRFFTKYCRFLTKHHGMKAHWGVEV